MDYINPCNKNQTAKVLERFFYVSNGREYISVIPEEAERITKLPTPDEVKKDTSRVVTYGRKKLCECVICGRHFIKVGNTKTCSQKCSDSLKKLNEGKQDKDKKEPAA